MASADEKDVDDVGLAERVLALLDDEVVPDSLLVTEEGAVPVPELEEHDDNTPPPLDTEHEQTPPVTINGLDLEGNAQEAEDETATKAAANEEMEEGNEVEPVEGGGAVDEPDA